MATAQPRWAGADDRTVSSVCEPAAYITCHDRPFLDRLCREKRCRTRNWSVAGVSVAQVQRRTLRVLVATQLLAGVGLAAGVAVGALLAADLLGGQALTGLPAALATAGGALAAVPISRLMTRSGRRPGLAAGYATCAAAVLAAAQVRSFALLLAGMLLFGAGNTASLLARYAAADLAAAHQRGRAISAVLFATTFGAVTGPNLVEPAGALARAVALPPLAGPFLLSVAAYAFAALLVTGLLRPDPLLIARTGEPAGAPAPEASAWVQVLRGPALTGLSAMVSARFVMVALMTMTPVHMRAHNHTLGVIGFVIGAHTRRDVRLRPPRRRARGSARPLHRPSPRR